jgi:hypothetical protein
LIRSQTRYPISPRGHKNIEKVISVFNVIHFIHTFLNSIFRRIPVRYSYKK